MGIRFQKRIRLFKGVTLNLSKTGSSLTVGKRGASINLRGDKLTSTLGIPGTGLSYRNSVNKGGATPPVHAEDLATPRTTKGSGWVLLFFVLLVLLVYWGGK